MIDTTLIIDYLDRLHPEPKTTPADPSANFIALLLEDYADEWLWRPAMHYRWSFANSAELSSSWLAEHSLETDISLQEKKANWVARQKGNFVDNDGVTTETYKAVEFSYHHALRTLETIFKERDFLLGDRPTQADFGFMGPMFRHFFCDPDPARLMRDTAPGVHEWVARMWNMKPERFASATHIESIPVDLAALLEPVAVTYLPYLQANQLEVVAEQEQLNYEALGVSWNEPTKPYRLWCLDRLRTHYQALEDTAQSNMATALNSPDAVHILSQSITGICDHLLGTLPYSATDNERTAVDSWGR